MALLPAVGILDYNGVRWDSLHRSKMSAKPEYTECGRIVKWVQYTLEVSGWLGGSVALDTTLEDYRVRLTKPAQTLFFTSKGFGDLMVNRVGPPYDVNWGPKPELLSWVSLGGQQGAFVTWRVTFCIPECPQNARYEGLITVVYQVDIDIDQDDFTSRTVSGHVLIAQTRQPFSNRVKYTADQFREQVIPAELPGFQRITRQFRVSKDRNRGDFNYVDKELPVPLPDNLRTFQVEQSISSKLEKGFIRWDVKFSGSGVAPAGGTKAAVLDAFLKTVQARIKGVQNLIGVRVVLGQRKSGVVPTNFSVSEQIFGKEVRFDFGCWFIQPGAAVDVLKTAGMFQPIPGTSFIKWQKSLANTSARGNANLTVPGHDEVLIDLCTPQKPTLPGTLTPGLLPPNSNLKPGLGPETETTLTTARLSLGTNVIPRELSWLMYNVSLKTVTVNREARHKKLPVENPQRYRKSSKGSADPTTSSADKAAMIPFDTIPEESAKLQDVIQILGSPSYEVVLSGMARRVEHEVAIPRLVSINGVEAVQIDAAVEHTTDGAVGGVPINLAIWSIRYALPWKYEGAVPRMANPALRTNGEVV